jgi:hypothetical protein
MRVGDCGYERCSGARLAAGCALALLAWVSAPPSARAQDGSDGTVSLKLNPDARFTTWESKYEDGTTVSSGLQYYMPFGGKFTAQNDQMKFDFTARSGFVRTKNTVTDDAGIRTTAEVETQTDTSVAGTVVLNSIPGIQPYASVAVNIPTGTTVLDRTERLALVDPDIVQVPSYGQGRNVAATVGANIPISDNAMISVAWGYNDRGAFRRLRPLFLVDAAATFDPGNTRTIEAGYSFEYGALSFWINGSSTRETASTLADDVEFFTPTDYYQSGKGTTVTGGLSYAWTPNFSTQIDISKLRYERNRVFDEVAFEMLKEPFNSNNELTTVSLQATYRFGSLALSPVFNYTRRKYNDWDPLTFQFVPSKTILATGLTASYALNDETSIMGRVERSWLHESDNPEKTGHVGSGVPPIDTDVWLYTVGGTVQF